MGSDVSRGRYPVSPDEAVWADAPFDAAKVFGRVAPLEIEIGSGKARFLIESARRNPAGNFLGLELALAYYRICRDRLARADLPNARIVRADGRRFAQAALPAASVRAFHVYFPDPWPKKRQRKRRLLDHAGLEILASRLEPGGLLRIATDHAGYAASVEPLLASVATLEELDWTLLPSPPETHYELKYRQEGRPVRRFLLRRR
ncbi:MAG TPA: tRNA (guanosine(46)-N7)-methyltransferase TrmB [Thermoanaerobaculia bacterium]|nr:tRNA (guanosine(46)-N7)-methyltransferase TrmB [Thermoanaerobaculia bacterium]